MVDKISSKNYQPGLSAEIVKKKFSLSKVIKLASNENPLGPCKKAVKAAENNLKFLNRYPDGGCSELIKRIKQYISKSYIKNENIIIGNGSNEILELTARAFLDKRSEVIISKHAFLVYKMISNSMKAKVVETSLYTTKDKDFMTINLNSIKNNITPRTKIIFIANPSNPTGTIVDTAHIDALIKSISKKIIVIIDEAYIEYACFRGHKSAIDLLKKYNNLIVTRSFSKIYAIAGSRVGYGLSNKNLIAKLNLKRQPFNVNQIGQIMALNSIGDKNFLQQSLLKNRQSYEYLIKELKKDSIYFIDSYTNFITIFFGKKSKIIFNKLLKKGIILRPLDNYGLPDYLRVTIGTLNECKIFIKNLRVILKSIN